MIVGNSSYRPVVYQRLRQEMVRTLVLTVDRDNDLGVKAGIRGPVVGRKATLLKPR